MNNHYTFDELENESFPSNYDINHTVNFGTVIGLPECQLNPTAALKLLLV